MFSAVCLPCLSCSGCSGAWTTRVGGAIFCWKIFSNGGIISKLPDARILPRNADNTPPRVHLSNFLDTNDSVERGGAWMIRPARCTSAWTKSTVRGVVTIEVMISPHISSLCCLCGISRPNRRWFVRSLFTGSCANFPGACYQEGLWRHPNTEGACVWAGWLCTEMANCALIAWFLCKKRCPGRFMCSNTLQ